MFVRPCWRPVSPRDAMEIIEQYPWALLVSNGEKGPLATNLPLMIDRTEPCDEDTLTLVGHIARANQHLGVLAQNTASVLAIFEGPWSYVTASWYPMRDMPSTYYYTAIHCYGTIEFQDDVHLSDALEDLVERMESSFADGWKTNEIPRSEITRRFSGIAGFRMRVSRIEAKFKLGQDEPLRDALAIADVLETHAALEDQKLATLIRKQNSGRAI